MKSKQPLAMEVKVDVSELEDVIDNIKSSIKKLERQAMIAKVCAMTSTTFLFAFIAYSLAS